MAAQKLTATKIDKHKPAKPDEFVSDGNGLYLRFRRGQTGLSRTWMYAYKGGTKSVYLTLGEHETSLPAFETAIYRLPRGSRLTLENARKIAVELTDWRRRNVDPKEFLQSETERLASETKAKVEADALLEKQNDVDKLSVQDLFDVWLRG
jgi:hypothetical protein